MIKKRILSLVLAGAMVLSMIPTNIMTKEVTDAWKVHFIRKIGSRVIQTVV